VHNQSLQPTVKSTAADFFVIHTEMQKKSTARRHHYLPQAYLAQFTDLGTKEGQFHVLEIESGHTFRTSPKNVAGGRSWGQTLISD